MKAAVALLGLIAVGASGPAADEPPALADLLVQAGKYVGGFQHDFATVISDEVYEQRERFSERLSGKDRISTAERTMRSELLFLWMPAEREWLSVRNVLMVDRKPVPDSRARLEQVLADTDPGTMGRLRNLRDGSARFNIGRLTRNLSDPTLALKVVDPAYQPRFAFMLLGSEVIGGISVLKVAFVERGQTPTMISVDGHGVTSRGAVWMTPNGIILRTRLELTDPQTLIDVSMSVLYGRDAKLGGWVPTRMDEAYEQRVDEAAIARATGDSTPTKRPFALNHAFYETISCSATYSNYRRFETSARILPR